MPREAGYSLVSNQPLCGVLARKNNVHGDGRRGEDIEKRARSSCPAKRGTRPFLLYTASKLASFLAFLL